MLAETFLKYFDVNFYYAIFVAILNIGILSFILRRYKDEHKKEITEIINKCGNKTTTGNKYSAILTEIEKSRKEAAALQIEGMQLADETTLDYWIQRVDEWGNSTYEKLEEFNIGEAGKFDTLSLFSVQFAAGTKILNAKHESKLRNLIRRMEILGEIRDRWIVP